MDSSQESVTNISHQILAMKRAIVGFILLCLISSGCAFFRLRRRTGIGIRSIRVFDDCPYQLKRKNGPGPGYYGFSHRFSEVDTNEIVPSQNHRRDERKAWIQPIMTGACLLILNIIHTLRLLIVDPFHTLWKKLKIEPLHPFYSNKTVLVTGASSGIGEAIVMKLAAMGANIILASRNKDKLEGVAAKCRLIAPSAKLMVVTVDMEDYDRMDEFYSACWDQMNANRLQAIDLLVLNAGISSRGSVVDTNMKTIERVMATNFHGPVALTKAFLPAMLERRSGSIAVISSVQGKLGIPLRSSYAASKHALQGFFSSLRAEVAGSGISVTVVSPGYVSTALSLNAVNGDGSTYGKMDETTSKGMSASKLAETVLRGIANRRADLVVADAKTVAAIQMNTMLPELLAKIIRKK